MATTKQVLCVRYNCTVVTDTPTENLRCDIPVVFVQYAIKRTYPFDTQLLLQQNQSRCSLVFSITKVTDGLLPTWMFHIKKQYTNYRGRHNTCVSSSSQAAPSLSSGEARRLSDHKCNIFTKMQPYPLYQNSGIMRPPNHRSQNSTKSTI